MATEKLTTRLKNKTWINSQINKIGNAHISQQSACLCNHCCNGKSLSILHSDCVFVVLVIQHAKRMHHILQSLAYLAHIFPHYLLKNKMWKKVIEHTMCILIFSTLLSETFLIIWRTDKDMIKNVHWSVRKVPVIFVQF
jgi:hypothetical protein